MSTLEDRIRDALRADAATVRPESIPGPPERPARKQPRLTAPGRPRFGWARALIPIAAAAAVAAVVAGIWVASPLQSGRGHQTGPAASPAVPTGLPTAGAPVSHGPLPSPTLGRDASRGVTASAPSLGVPRYYITVNPTTNNVTDQLIVRATATGTVVARLDSPPGDDFATIAAPAGDRTFVTAVMPSSGCSAQLYQFRLSDQGQPGPLLPLHVTVPGNYSENGDLAITPDGRTIAYATCRL